MSVLLVKETELLFMATRNGMAICTPVKEFRVFASRDSEGVRGCKLKGDDKVAGVISVQSDEDLVLTVADNGLGKISAIKNYRTTHRGGVGVINMKFASRKGKVVNILNITKESEVILITEQSHFLRFSLEDLRVSGRNTSGVKLCNLNDKDKIIEAQKV